MAAASAAVRDGLVRTGAPALEVFAEWEEPRPGAGRPASPADRPARRRMVEQLGDLCALAAITFEPGATPDRGKWARRFDWGLFTWNTTATGVPPGLAPLHPCAEAA